MADESAPGAAVRRPRALFYVQHLLGIGHLRRAATLARAMVAAGLDVTLVSGGHEIPGLRLDGARLVQLPPVRATDLYFKNLVDAHDRPIDEAWRTRRREALLAAWRETAPDLLLLELFPFGRRQMRFELLPLLQAAKGAVRPPVIVSSVRDILVAQDKPGRNDEMLDLAASYFDHVLVHGDPAFIPFERTFPHVTRITDRLTYTGYVVDRSAADAPDAGETGDGVGEVLVSAGGGAVGERLLRAAMAARPLTPLADRRWRVLVGVTVPQPLFEDLQRCAEGEVIVERARGDFPALLRRCTLSVSQAGYNTLMEALEARCRIVAVPYAGGLETEQTLRAGLLAQRGLLQLVPEDRLEPARIAEAVAAAMAAPPPARAPLRTDGAETSARLLFDWAAARTGPMPAAGGP